MEDRPLYNSRIVSTYIDFIGKNYPYIDINELLKYARVEPYQVNDEGHWFTQEQHDRLHEKLVELTGNKNIAREAGQYAASSKGVGLLKQYAVSWMGPLKVFSVLGHISSKFTRSSVPTVKKISSNAVEVSITFNEGVQEKPYQCENRMGFYQSILDLFKHKMLRIDHPECLFKGGKACRYIISWENPPSALWKKIRIISAIFSLAIAGTLIHFFTLDFMVILTTISIFLLLTYVVELLEKKELNSTINNFRKLTEKQIDQIDINYKNALMINEIGQAISKKLDIDSILENIMQSLESRLYYDRGMILLVDSKETQLFFSAGFGLGEEQLKVVKETTFDLRKPETRGVFVLSFREQKPYLVNDINELKETISAKSLEYLKKMGSKSFVCCPIVYEKDSLGVLVVDNIEKKREFTQTDVSLLMGIAPQIGISINNALLIDQRKQNEEELKQSVNKLRKTMGGIIQAMALAVECRDPYTAGHQRRVADLARSIAQERGLSKDQIEAVRMAGIVHDLGKISIPAEILSKPTKLSPLEFGLIKVHPQTSYDILKDIEFPWPIAGIVLQHHERIDGSGYPAGLKDQEILPEAKVLMVADVVEAIASHRPYRPAYGLEVALEEISRNRGILYDPEVVDACLKLFKEKGFTLE